MSLEHCNYSPTQSQKNPRPGVDTKHGHSAGKDINVLVLGRKGVGKTALTVRYLTRRFIGDYNSELEMLYSHSTSIDGKHVTLHIIDTLGQTCQGDVSPEQKAPMTCQDDVSPEQVLWADAVVVVFAVNDVGSFDVAACLVERVHSIRGEHSHLPLVALVANKSDLIERRSVSETSVSRLCAEYTLGLFETSASETQRSVAEVFVALGRQVRHVLKKREKLTRFVSNPAVAAKLQIRQSLKNLFAERSWRARTSTL